MIPTLGVPNRYRTVSALVIALSLPGCFGSQSETGVDPKTHTWVLHSIDGAPYQARATLLFPNRGRIAGAAPCNRYSATMEATLPAFEVGSILSTRRACPDLAFESAYFKALNAMERAASDGQTLTLMGPDGRDMVFKAAD